MGMSVSKRILPFEKNTLAFLAADLSVIGLVLILGFGLARFLTVSSAPFVAEAPIDTSLGNLPSYALLSLTRSLIALSLSYFVAILYGSIAARKPSYEKVMIPALDVLQSLPVVSFMPGFVFALTALFPQSRWGLELACILMIFTGQVWNLVFAFYESQSALSPDLRDVSKIVGLGNVRRFFVVDLPNGIRPLVYNGMMSMAGGWFFLTLCEAFPLGSKSFRLPGLGSYMKLAFEQQNTTSFVAGLCAMGVLIIGVDFFLWKPLIAWSGRFREEASGEEQSLFLDLLEKTQVVPSFLRAFENWREKRDALQAHGSRRKRLLDFAKQTPFVRIPQRAWTTVSQAASHHPLRNIPLSLWVVSFGLGALAFQLLVGLPEIARSIEHVSKEDWLRLIRALFLTAGKVLAVLVFATIWTVPVGLWIGKSPRVAKFMQPVVQNIAAFPAPVLFPLIAMTLIQHGWNPQIIALTLMTIGNQWYLFFNVISGASRIPEDLKLVARAYQLTRWQRWRFLYFPAIFPSLVTGWITAAGGSWNTSIVAELVTFPGGESRAQGIGLELTRASAQGDNTTLAAAVCVITIALVVLNRSLWRTLHLYAERLKST
jgi:NitT/TauT family transport system permease protein